MCIQTSAYPVMMIHFLLSLLLTVSFRSDTNDSIYLPIQTSDRQSLNDVPLTPIGQFGILRDARPHVPAHYHTGIDIMRPHTNYKDEPIFPVARGVVMSKRDDGPYAQLILEHNLKQLTFWTLYEHISGITAEVGEPVYPHLPVARFMNESELNTYGWQFDHFHFEILKTEPLKVEYDPSKPDRYFGSYTLMCYTEADLNTYFYNPIEFFEYFWQKR